MRIGVAHLGQETNTFNPQPTVTEDFAAFGILEGHEMLDELADLGPVGGTVTATRRAEVDVELVPLVRAWSTAGGRLSRDAHRELTSRLDANLDKAAPLDGLALHVHGACAAEDDDDVDGALVERCRARLGDDVPIVGALDHHANITARMMRGFTATVGYRTQPHQPFETAELATELLLSIVSGRYRPVVRWRKIPLIAHQEQFLTSEGPMKDWFDRARRCERDHPGARVSTYPMQPWFDVEEPGWSVVAVTDGDEHLAERIVAELAQHAWHHRSDFQHTTAEPVAQAVGRADDDLDGLVVLSDTGDSVLGGAAGDSTVLMSAMLERPIRNRALLPIVDPAVATQLHRHRDGDRVSVTIGGAVTGLFSSVTIDCSIRRLARGRIEINDHSQRFIDMGRTAVVESGPLTILVSERRGIGGVHPQIYRHHGVEPTDYRMVVVKTASNFQYFAPWTTHVVRVASPGPTQSDLSDLPWKGPVRSLYPLDPNRSFTPPDQPEHDHR